MTTREDFLSTIADSLAMGRRKDEQAAMARTVDATLTALEPLLFEILGKEWSGNDVADLLRRLKGNSRNGVAA